MGVTGQRLAF
uniref:Uncharacterized protein n=1 Tax=Arundo donax TaxID=35708 RepID=A0A0A9D5C7_ARUDO